MPDDDSRVFEPRLEPDEAQDAAEYAEDKRKYLEVVSPLLEALERLEIAKNVGAPERDVDTAFEAAYRRLSAAQQAHKAFGIVVVEDELPEGTTVRELARRLVTTMEGSDGIGVLDAACEEVLESMSGKPLVARGVLECVVGPHGDEILRVDLVARRITVEDRALKKKPGRVPVRAAPTVGRNAACPCGSGRKFKKCCS